MRLQKYLDKNFTIVTLKHKGRNWILSDENRQIIKTNNKKDIVDLIDGYVSQPAHKIINIVKKTGSFSFMTSRNFAN